MPTVLTSALVALVVTSAALPAVIALLRNRRVLDLPNTRSSHSVAVPRGAGIALAIGVSGALAITEPGNLATWVVVVGYTAIGAWDDFSPRSARIRLSLQLLLAAAAAALLIVNGSASGYFILLGVPLIAAAVNATNFMDGINGITGLHALVWGVTYCVLLATGPFQTLAPFAAGVGAAGLAFLPWNMWNARAFLGDSGSYFIGGAVGMLSLATIASGNLVAGLLPLATYAADTGTVVLRHLAKAQPVILAHHDHTYQQMLVQGWPHPRTAFVTALFSTACCVLALLAQGQGMPGQTLATAATVLVCFLYLSLPRWSRRRQMRSGQGRTQ